VATADSNQDISRKARKLASTSVLPFAILLFAILAAVVLTVLAMAQRSSDAADIRTGSMLQNAVLEATHDVARDVYTYSELERPVLGRGVSLELVPLERYLERIRAIGDFDAVSIINGEGRIVQTAVRLVYGSETPEQRYGESLKWAAEQLLIHRNDVKPNTSPSPSPSPSPSLIGRSIYEDQQLRLVGAAWNMRQDNAPFGIVAIRSLDDQALSRLGGRLSISGLSLHEPIGAGANQLALLTTGGNRAAALTWTPERPGDPLLNRLLPIAISSGLAIMIFAWLAFAHVTRVTTSMLNSEAVAHHLAGHDTLSGLPNRMRFSEHLTGLLPRAVDGDGIAVLFIDLDKFKQVNDTYGHAAGDEVLVGCAQRMAKQLRANDVLARFGGDEFAVIQTGVKSALDAEVLARRIIDSIRPAFQLGDAEAYVGASIGVALAPSNGRDAAELMRLADIAMYRAKNEGRNRACFFEQRMDDTLRLRKVVEDDLRHAIVRNELELHYQPQVSADGSKIVGVEALVRWRHPVHGLIPPIEFIGIAEERGLIIQLGEWVIRRACLDAKNWPDVSIACNVSAIQFRQTDFVQSVSNALAETGFDPTRLELELTESIVVANADQAEDSMMDLRAMGVKLALDDFGTGYSSLIYLRRFAFDKIKLDKSFLDSLEDTGESAILVHSVVHLGRALGLTVPPFAGLPLLQTSPCRSDG
jgi:diguanylate cyclase